MKTLTIFCSGKTGIKQEYIQIVQKFVNTLDKSKIRIAYGGGNVGLMGVVRDAYDKRGGKVVTSNIHQFVVDGYPDDYLFDNITDRQRKLVELGDMFLALPGGFGTVYELLEVITKNQIGEMSKPVFVFNYNGIYDNFRGFVNDLIREGFVKHEIDWYKLKFFSDPVELANAINKI